MKKKLSIILAFVLAFCISIPVFADPTLFPTTKGDPADKPSEFIIQKKYVKLDGTSSVDRFPAETLKFEAVCTAAPMATTAAPNLTVADLKVSAVKNDITVTVPAYSVPGKYNYEIKEQTPSEQDPVSEDTAGVVYDDAPVFIQVVVKYEQNPEKPTESILQKFVTVAGDGTNIDAETEDDKANDSTKKADFKNKYLLDGEVDPTDPDPTPEPDPNPIPTPDPDKPEPDPIIPIPDPENPDKPEPSPAELAKFKIMKQVRGPLASRDQEFTVHVTLESEKPVRSDIICNDGTEHVIKKVDDQTGSSWKQEGDTGYKATVDLEIKNGEVVTFKGVPAGVKYTVKEDVQHIAKLDKENINDPSKGYTVSYYGGGTKVDNPTPENAAEKGYGKNNFATGKVGKNANNNIIIANSKGLNNEDSDMVKPNTGINLDSLPYIIILCLVIAGAGMMLVKSRKRGEE